MSRNRIKGTTAMLVEQERRERGTDMSTKPDYAAAIKAWGDAAPPYSTRIPYRTELRLRAAVDAALGGDPVAFAVAALIAEGGEIRYRPNGDKLLVFKLADGRSPEPNLDVVFPDEEPLPVESAEAKETP